LFSADTGPVKVRVIERLKFVDQSALFGGQLHESDDTLYADVLNTIRVFLIHDLAALDHHEAIQLLAENGCNLNLTVKDTNITPLVIAAARGFDQTV
jgi:hypothetical protein